MQSLTPVLETPRLWLRPLQLEDADQVQQLFPQWEVVRLLSNAVPWSYPPHGSRQFYENVALPAIARGDEWHWTLRLKTQPEQVIGAMELPARGNFNRGLWLGLPRHGQGLMTEACDAVTDYWFDVLRHPRLRAPKASTNLASRRISEKQGMRVAETKDTDSVSGPVLTEVWEITSEEWRARRVLE